MKRKPGDGWASGTEYTYPMRCTALENAEGGFGGEPYQKNHQFMGDYIS